MSDLIKVVPDFPKKGVNFYDISPLMANPREFGKVLHKMFHICRNYNVDSIGAFDSRGFLFGPLLAQQLSLPFFMIRKAGKLPPPTVSTSYGLEYGQDKIEIQKDAPLPRQNVLLIDDVLATGGTANAGVKLVEGLGGTVSAFVFLIELGFLNGRKSIEEKNIGVNSLLNIKGA